MNSIEALPPPATAPPPTGEGSPPGAPPGAQPFQSALDEQWARTATAEGQASEEERSAKGSAEAPEREGEALPVLVTEAAEVEAALAALTAPVVALAPVPAPAASEVAQTSQAPVPAPEVSVAQSGARALEAAPLEVAPSSEAQAPHVEIAPVQPSAAPAQAPASEPLAAAPVQTETGPPPVAAPTGEQASQAPALAPARAPASEDAPAPSVQGEGEGGSAQHERPASPAPAPVPAPAKGEAVRPAQAGQPAAPAPAATPAGVPSGEAASAALQAQNPAAPTTAPEGPVLAAGVEMQEMIDSLRGTIELAARQGVAHARIALHPEELGHVRIELIKRGDGLIARVSAETPEAARALSSGRAELAHSLRELGGTLLSLDIGSSGEYQARGQGADGAQASGSAEREAQDGEQTTGGPAMLDGEGALSGPAKGELVDVLA